MSVIEHWLAYQRDTWGREGSPVVLTEGKVRTYRESGWKVEGPYVPTEQLQGALEALRQIEAWPMPTGNAACAGALERVKLLARQTLGGQS